MCMIMFGCVSVCDLITNLIGTTRGHIYKVMKPRAVSRVRRNNLSVRTVDDWNSLPGWVVESTSTDSFKNNIDRHWAELKYVFPT